MGKDKIISASFILINFILLWIFDAELATGVTVVAVFLAWAFLIGAAVVTLLDKDRGGW